MTLVAAAEMGRYGVTVNAIAPSADPDDRDGLRRHDVDRGQRVRFDGAREHFATRGVARQRRVARRHGQDVRGRGRHHPRCRGLGTGKEVDKGARWDPAELGPVVKDLLAKARPPVPVFGA